MKLHTSLLEKFIDLPTKDPKELRALLDDVGLEVKDVETNARETIFTIETLANRGDHLSALGVARELSARLLTSVKHPSVVSLPDRNISIPFRVESTLCMKAALLEMAIPYDLPVRDEITAITGYGDKKHAIVSILNYAALEYGQPMHAFDRDKIEGEIVVCALEKEEEIVALDGKTYRVPAGALIHRDRKKILDVAGVIGCANCMSSETTTRVLIEAASFDPVSVRITARKMGISTDASYTFERGCDVEMPLTALKRVAYLAHGAQLVGLSHIEGAQTEQRKVQVSLLQLKKQINLPRLPSIEIISRLKNLGYGVEAVEGDKEIVVSVPSWRLWDVKNEADIVEDFVRSHGLNNVKLDLPSLDYEIPEPNEVERVLARIEAPLTGNGFFEVITRSFYSAEDVKFLDGISAGFAAKHVTLKNSLESSYSHLKATNIHHFAAAVSSNLRMGVQSVKIFEFGRLFSLDEKGEQIETDTIAIGAAGRWFENEWKKPESTEDLFAHVKGVIISLFQSIGRECEIREGKNPFLHPGMQGTVVSGRETVGTFGVVHPKIKDRVGLKTDLVYGELRGEIFSKGIQRKEFVEPADYPAIRRDLTLKVAKNHLAGKVVGNILGQEVPELSAVTLIDDFSKDGEDFRRVTYRLTFQSLERTLAHEEVDKSIKSLLDVLRDKYSLEVVS